MFKLDLDYYSLRNASTTYFLTHSFWLVKIHMGPTIFLWDPHNLVGLMWIWINQREYVEKCMLKCVLLTFLVIVLAFNLWSCMFWVFFLVNLTHTHDQPKSKATKAYTLGLSIYKKNPLNFISKKVSYAHKKRPHISKPAWSHTYYEDCWLTILILLYFWPLIWSDSNF